VRITNAQYKQALKYRYRDLRDLIEADNSIGTIVHHDNKRLVEMRAIASIAKLHGVQIKDD